MNKTILVLLCDDFRLSDNPALFNACLNSNQVILLYVYNENYLGRKLGSASKVFLHHTLKSFNSLVSNQLLLKEGNAITEIKKIDREEKIDAIYFNRSYTKAQIELEEAIKISFPKKEIKSFKSKLLFEPSEIQTGSGRYFKVFTPFWKKCLQKIDLISPPLPQPKNINFKKHQIQSLTLDDLNLLPKNEGNWHQKTIQNWAINNLEFDYKKISQNIADFAFEKISNYSEARNIPSLEATSKISPYLRFGLISIGEVFSKAQNNKNSTQFIAELCWREFAYHVMFYHQDLSWVELKPEYKEFQFIEDKESFKKWQKGETGYDIVDAGMKELWQTGWMHNRVRMITASFLIKDLLIDWKSGEEWFWNTLFDACPATNPFSWQWVFGSGFDSAPYFRIFNPDLQRDRFDPKKEYCQKWLGKNYQTPKIVDHNFQRKITLELYKKCKN